MIFADEVEQLPVIKRIRSHIGQEVEVFHCIIDGLGRHSYVKETGILHQIEIDSKYDQIRYILKPGPGQGFYEISGHIENVKYIRINGKAIYNYKHQELDSLIGTFIDKDLYEDLFSRPVQYSYLPRLNRQRRKVS